jgi:hypothetical protein
VLIGMVWIVLPITFTGRVSDHVGRRPGYAVSAAAMILLAVPPFQLVKMHGTWPPILGVLVLSTLLGLLRRTECRHAADAVSHRRALRGHGHRPQLRRGRVRRYHSAGHGSRGQRLR